MRIRSLLIVVLLGLPLYSGLTAGQATGPPAPVPYERIPDPPDDAERHITVRADDRGPVWLLTGFLHGWEPGIEFEHLARVKPRHMRMGLWPFWHPRSLAGGGKTEWGDVRDSPETLGKYLDTMLRLRETGMKWQLNLHFKGRYYAWHSFVNDANEKQLADYSDHISTLVKYCRDMGLPVDYWEVTNEPAHPHHTEEKPGGYFKHSWEDFLDYWDASYGAVRAAYPEAKIVGPSFGGAGEGNMVNSIDMFLSHCKEKGQTVNVLSWHINCCYQGPNGSYWDEVDCVHREIEEVRALVETKFPMVGVERYHIDEWGYYLPQTGMGAQVAYFYYMDLAGADGAAKTGPPYIMSGTRISPDTPRAAYWAWAEYAKQDGGVRLVTTTNDRNLVCLASRHDGEKVVRALVGRAKRQSMADPPESAPKWKWGDSAPAKPPVAATIDFEGLPRSGKAEVTILRLPPGTGPLYEDELAGFATTTMMDAADGKLTIELADVVEDNAFAIVIGPPGTRAKEKERDAQWAKTEPDKNTAKSERELHKEATAKAREGLAAGVMRVNCASWRGTIDAQGNGWFADREYAAGEWGYLTEKSSTSARREYDISGTATPEIYRTERWAMPGYKFAMANGSYLVRLHFAETYGADRKFDITIEDETVLKDFNPRGEAGGVNKAFFREFTVQVEDGELDIDFVGLGIINAIEVVRK